MGIVVFDIGGSAVKFGLWSEDELIGKGSFKTPKSWENMKEKMLTTYLDFTKEYPISGVAISTPGSVNETNGMIGGISAVPYLHHFPIKKEWEAMFEVPVSMENDANCAALAEVWLGVAKEIQNALFLVIGSGIGGAVITNRKLNKGTNLFGGEFGYMLLDKTHTLSELGSPVQVAERYGKEIGLADSVDGKYLFEQADLGEPIALKYMESLIDALSRGIYNLSVSFNPDMIIIGGGISVRKDFIARLAEQTAYYQERQNATDMDVTVRACAFHNDANLIGAVAHFEQSLHS